MSFAQDLGHWATGVGVSLTEEQCRKLEEFWLYLSTENRRFNLTRIVDEQEAVVKHFIDSLTPLLLPDMSRRGRLIDVGSGAGFPGIPLAVAAPTLHVSLLESVGKKADFLRRAVEKLDLPVQVIHGRAEDVARDARFRETFDVSVARALAPLPVACEWCLPFVKVGGWFVAMRGAKGREDLEEAHRAIELLGGRVAQVEEMELPNEAGRRVLIALEKVKPTAADYPRTGGVARRRPL